MKKQQKHHGDSDLIIDAFTSEYGNDDIAAALDAESDDYTEEGAKAALEQLVAATPDDAEVTYEVQDEETLEITDTPKVGKGDLETAVAAYLSTDPDSDYAKENYGAPDTAEYGVWVPGIPVLVEKLLDAANCVEWLRGLILDGIVAGVGAVLGFVPQMLVLFLLLAFLEACGYMARIAFVLDRIFRRFGLSGKSFIPILIGTGCGIPGIMASRTIENERDRRMTIMTTTFIPCGARATVYRHDRRCNLRRFTAYSNRRLLHGYGSNYYFRYYAQEDKDVLGRAGTFCNGASGLPLADNR